MYIRSLKECNDSSFKMPGSDDPHGFELLVRDCASIELKQDFHLYGRSGQEQHGIDIFSDDWTILIQCKAYSETTKNYEAFRKDIKDELTKAKAHFQREGKPFFRRFILATTLIGDGPAQEITRDIPLKTIDEKLCEQEPNLNVTVWFRGKLLEIINNYRIRNDGDTYAKEFEETLFLHKNQLGCENVNLNNLFVFQEYREIEIGKKPSDPIDDLEERIQRFCGDGNDKMLIIEGDAGTGKSTLAAKLCFEERKHSRQILDTVPEGGSPSPSSSGLLAGSPLLTVRLRDLKISGNEEHQLGLSILSHLEIRDKEELKKLFPRAVLLLDGFDELYMKLQTALGKAFNCENMLNQLCGWLPGGCKLILTSRPKCVNVNRLSKAFSSSVISLEHFSPRKREIWLNQYRNAFPENGDAVDEEVAQYILSIDKGSVSNLCDTPMTLYLLIGSKAKFELTKNEWALYRYIFADAVVNTPYTEQADGTHPIHPMGPDIGGLLYWITEEIAYKMYCAGEAPEDQSTIRTEDGQFLVTGETVRKIINDLLQNEQFRKEAEQAGLNEAKSFDLQRIHALCCYWRSGSTDGPVEFYHNNIRNFFFCEKIRRELNQLYQERGTDEEKTKKMALCLVNLFKYGEINETVCRFLRSFTREAVFRQDEKEFPLLEKRHPLLPWLYQNLLTQGRLFDKLERNDHINSIRNILLNTGLVYHQVYKPILKEGERIHWWNDLKAVNRSLMMKCIFKTYIGEIAFMSDLRGVDLTRADLRWADLSRTDFSGADLRWADLSGADLSGTDLSGTDLRWAYLFKASLHLAHLLKADLSHADLRGADLSGAGLLNADLLKADLRGADLSGAGLRGADLRGADLYAARLPDGFRSIVQEEQIEHLKSLKIPGLKL